MAGKYSFIVKYEQECILENMNDEQIGQLFRMLFAYCKRGETNGITGDPSVMMAFSLMRGSIDIDTEKYKAACEAKKKAMEERWREHFKNQDVK